MVSLMQRRREMMGLQKIIPAPLYSFEDRDFTLPSSSGNPRGYLQITNGNHFLFYGTRRGTGYQANVNFTSTSVSADSSWSKMFTFETGDSVVVKLKNVVLQYNRSDTSYNGYIYFTFRDMSGTFVCGWADSSSSAPLYINSKNGKTITYDELSISYIPESDIDISAVRIYEYGSTQSPRISIECDLELYVNDVRWI